jgi:hypothetical protein
MNTFIDVCIYFIGTFIEFERPELFKIMSAVVF